MFCAECGQKMDDGAKFCSNCGKPVNRAGNVGGGQTGAAGTTGAEKAEAPSSIVLPDIPGETMVVSSAAISADGNCMAVFVRGEGELRTIDTRSGETLRSMDWKVSGKVELLAVSSDGGFVVIHGEDTRIVNIQTGEHIELDVNYQGDISVNRVCFSHDSKRLAFTRGDSRGERLTIIAVPKGDKVLSIDLPEIGFGSKTGYIDSIAFSPDRKFIAVGHDENGTILWDVRSGSKIFEQETERSQVAFSPDGSRIAVAGDPFSFAYGVATREENYTVYIFDAKSGDVLLKFKVTAKYCANKIRFSPDGSAIVICEYNGAIKIISAETGEILRQFHADDVKWASYTPDGKKFVSFSGSADEACVKYWVSE